MGRKILWKRGIFMKKCEKCGTPQKNSHFRCIECGAILGKPLSRADEERMEEQISDYIADRAERTETFYITRLDKIMIALDILVFLASALYLIFGPRNADGQGICLFLILIFLLAGIDTAFPKIAWTLEKWRVEMRYHVENLEPSDWYLITRKIINVVFPILAYMALLFVLVNT